MYSVFSTSRQSTCSTNIQLRQNTLSKQGLENLILYLSYISPYAILKIILREQAFSYYFWIIKRRFQTSKQKKFSEKQKFLPFLQTSQNFCDIYYRG